MRNNFYPLTHPQKGIWFTEKLYPGSSIGIVAGTVRIRGKFDCSVLEKAINIFLENNDSIRMRVVVNNGQPEQYISDYRYIHPDFIDFGRTGLKGLEDWEEQQTRIPFETTDGNLFYFALVKVSEEYGGVYIKTHHLISDAWTMSLIIDHIIECYSKILTGEAVDKIKKPSYIEYILKEEKYKNSTRFVKDKEFWDNCLHAYPEITKLKDWDAGLRSTEAKRKSYFIPIDMALKIYMFCKENKLSLYALFMAALAIYTNRVTSKSDIIIGTLVLNRSNVREKETVGMFIGTIPIKLNFDAGMDFISFIRMISRDTLQFFRHREYPYELMLKDARDRHKGLESLYDILLSYQNVKLNKGEIINDYNAIWHFNGHQTNSLSMHINERECDGNIQLDYDYLCRVFTDEEIENIHKSILALVQDALENPCRELCRLNLMDSEERNRLLYKFNDTAVDFPRNKTIQQLFEEQVDKTPDVTALIFENVSLKYRVLNEKSNQLAKGLRAQGVKPDGIVGLMVHRSLDMMIGIMGILKAGAAYLPLDPEYPRERINFMLKDSSASLLLTEKRLDDGIDFEGSVMYITDSSLYEGDGLNLINVNTPADLAYVIYTSGSTGKPKGVMLEHKSVNNFFKGMRDRIDFSPDKKILSVTTISFDIFVLETLLPLTCGLTVVIANERQQKMPHLLNEVIVKYNIGMIQTTPSRMKLLINDEKGLKCINNLTEIMIGGEPFPPPLLEKLRSSTNARIYNMYGPTETTVWSSVKDMSGKEMINIGTPIANTRIYIMDKHLNLVPEGIAGQLCIGGEGLARGYLNRPEQTSEKFVSNPIIPGERIYLTGDLARWLPEGEIEHLGRIDQQVKLRGYRIELGEIESRLLEYEGIRETVVVDRENKAGEKYLCAYMVSDEEIQVSKLRKFLLSSLPGYMVPSSYARVDRIPLTPNGKLDRNALPESEPEIRFETEYVAPRNASEEKLVEIWSELLDVEKMGINDDYFELGADSLSIIAVSSRVYREFGIELPLVQIYKVSTIAELAECIDITETGRFEPECAGTSENGMYASLQPVPEQDCYPVSLAQRGLFLIARLGNTDINYNMPHFMLVEGELDREKFNRAFEQIVKRHDVLRTTFDIVDGEPVQRILSELDFDIDYKEADESQLEDMFFNFIRPFDLSIAPLMRISVVRLNNTKHVLLFDMHHIISDGTSAGIIIQELDMLYNGKTLPDLKLRYRDYAVWQNKLLESGALKQQEEYWLNRFSEEAPVLNMPLDFQRPVKQSFEGNKISFRISAHIAEQLKKLALNTGSTLYMVLLASYNVLLSKYTGQDDIVVGSPIIGRGCPDFNGMVGMFVNTLAMRNHPNINKTFVEFLYEVRDTALDAYVNQYYPFEELVRKLRIKRDASRNPLFDTLFVLQNVDVNKLGIDGLSFKPYEFVNRTSKFDIALEAVETIEGIHFNLEYCTRLFKQDTMKRLKGHFVNILTLVSENPDIKISKMDMLSEEERFEVLSRFNNTDFRYPKHMTVHELFGEQAKKTPESYAAVFEGKRLTYREVDEKSDQLAAALREKGVGPNDIVGISVRRSPEMIIGVLGILKAGGGFLPIDPDYPEERIKYMLEDSRAGILLSQKDLADRMRIKGEIIFIDDEKTYSGKVIDLTSINKPGDLLYVIYTSGSTGKPKGVMLEHRNMVNLISYEYAHTNIDFKSRVLQFTTISFDVCYQEIFSTLLCGGTLYIASDRIKKDVVELLKFVEENSIDTIFIPPAYLKLIFSNDLYIGSVPGTIRHIVVAGEQVIVTGSLKDFLKKNKVYLHNHYGPSETHVVSSYTVDPGGDIPELPPIGRPISNTKIYILDEGNNLTPAGVWGELHISGDCLGRGYLYREQLTSEKFVENPFLAGAKMYKTGDLARWLPDGNLEFLGRKDNQVKIRGFRVELGEIESHLLNYEGVREAAVIVRLNSHGNKYLCAYIITDRDFKVSEARKYLLNKIPEYMVPSYFVCLDRMPLTPSGKIDRKSLPEPGESICAGDEYEGAGNEVEEKLVQIWREVLEREEIGVKDNFFELGGDSLSILHVQAKAFSYNWGLTTQDFYKYQTIRELSEKILGVGSEKEASSVQISHDMVSRRESPKSEMVVSSMKKPLKKVLLTGATGFLGAHILDTLLSGTEADVYCLVREKPNDTTANRFGQLLDFYFPGKYRKYFGKRIFMVKGDITLPDFGLNYQEYSDLADKVDDVIHAAALVKHYGDYSEFEKANVFATEEAIRFSIFSGSMLYHISTTGISGNNYLSHETSRKEKAVFTENDFYIGQNYTENMYVKSKFEAENLIFKAMSKGLRASVLRVGQLTGRYSDGHFQINIDTNAFYNKIRAMIKIGAIPDNIIDQSMELTPVDYCSKAMVLLCSMEEAAGRVFHVYNHNTVSLKYLLDVAGELNIAYVKAIDKASFNQYVRAILDDKNSRDFLIRVIDDFSDNELRYEEFSILDSRITQGCLRQIGFEWPGIDKRYVSSILTYMNRVGFLD